MNKFILLSYPLMFMLTMTALFVFVSNRQDEIKVVKKVVKVIPTPTVVPTTREKDVVINYIKETFGDHYKTALLIAQEHNMNCEYGKETDHQGLFAIDTSDYRASGDLLDCVNNIDVAAKIFSEEGFAPWGK